LNFLTKREHDDCSALTIARKEVTRMTSANAPAPRELARQKAKLQRAFSGFHMLFFTICALIGLDALGQVSSFGAATFTWVLLLGLGFLLPYALVTAELGTAFPQEGGPYEWVKMAFGRPMASLATVLYWVTNPIWIAGSLAFAAAAAWSAHVHPLHSGTVGDWAFKLVFIWFSVAVAIISLRRARWITTAGAFARIGTLAVFSFTVVIYAIGHGLQGPSFHPFAAAGSSGVVVFLGLVPLLLFNYVGFELQSAAGEEMINPQRDVPRAVFRSMVTAIVGYAVPIFGIVFVLPQSKITGISGFMDAVGKTFSVYGAASHFMIGALAVVFVFALATSGAVWVMGADRMLAVSAADGTAPRYLGAFSTRLGTPVRVNVVSGVMASIFLIAAQQLQSSNTFLVVLYMATSTTLLSYLLIFPAGIRLRFTQTAAERPYRLGAGGSNALMWLCSGACVIWMAIGSITAIVPGLFNSLLGYHYDIRAVYGVGRGRFEAFTLITLAVILGITLVFYVVGGSARRSESESSSVGVSRPVPTS
jgi:glutamate:GABA antiporter